MWSMELIKVIRVELEKNFKNRVLWLLLLVPIFPALINHYFIFSMSYEEFLQRVQSVGNDEDPYNYVFKWFKILYQFYLIPYYAIVAIWLCEIERKSRGWKYMLSFPVGFSNILYAKVSTVILYFIFATTISFVSFYISVWVFEVYKTDWTFSSYQAYDWSQIALIIFISFASSLPALIAIFFVVMLYDNPGIIVIGSIVLSFIGLHINPFHFHFYAFDLYEPLRSGFGLDLSMTFYLSILLFIVELMLIKFLEKRIRGSITEI
jgi:hypothetical protein